MLETFAVFMVVVVGMEILRRTFPGVGADITGLYWSLQQPGTGMETWSGIQGAHLPKGTVYLGVSCVNRGSQPLDMLVKIEVFGPEDFYQESSGVWTLDPNVDVLAYCQLGLTKVGGHTIVATLSKASTAQLLATMMASSE